MAELRAYCHIDRMQPQFASLFASSCRGFLSVEGMASLFVEILPGVVINRYLAEGHQFQTGRDDCGKTLWYDGDSLV